MNFSIDTWIQKHHSIEFRIRCHKQTLGESPGLVAMGGDSCFKGREFVSLHHILDGHFFTYLFVAQIVMCLKDVNKSKRGRGWPIFFKKKQF